MKRRTFLRTIGGGALTLAGVSCGLTGRLRPAQPNVVIALVDQLRNDSFDAWASRVRALAPVGARFTHMRSAAPWTYPSVLSMFSGLYPQQHGANGEFVGKGLKKFSEKVPLLHRILNAAGYSTGAFVTNPFLHVWNSFHVGFDHFDASFIKNPGGVRPLPRQFAIPRRMFADVVNAAVVEHYSAKPVGKPEFTYLHYIDVHGPYVGAPFRPDYQSSVEYIDERLIEMYRFFMERYDENVYFIVTADHGVSLGDDLQVGAGPRYRKKKLSCHDFNTRIPFSVLPSAINRRTGDVAVPCSNVDVVPTVLDLVDIKPSHALVGRSLAPVIKGQHAELPQRPVYSTVSAFGGSSDSVTLGHQKYMRFIDHATGAVTAHKLFDTASDPRELNDIGGDVARFEAVIEREASDHGLAFAAEDETLEPEVENQLKALGYLR